MHDKGKIACLLADGFEDSEFQIPCDWLSAAGYTVEIIGARAGDALKGEKGRETVVVDLSIDEADVDELRRDADSGRPFARHPARGRPVRGVRARVRCDRTPAGGGLPRAPDSAHRRAAGGRTLTAWPTVQGDLRQAGAHVVDRDGRGGRQLDHQPQAGRSGGVHREVRRGAGRAGTARRLAARARRRDDRNRTRPADRGSRRAAAEQASGLHVSWPDIG